MNHKMIFYTLGQILKLEAALLVLPFAVSLIYGEFEILAFVIPIAISVGLGFLLTIKKPATTNFYAKDGFVIVGLSWIVLSVIGCLPFIISGAIPKFFDALFETISGFTTTGATILDGTRIEGLTHGMAFWRCFTHWIGGMGVLVFVLAILPNADGKSIHILRAESPGPQVGKLVSKIRITARILYLIYIAITVTEIIFLVCGDMNLFEAIVHTFSTAGTGGFSTKADSIGAFSAYSQVVIGIFMLLFGMNFNLFYLLLLGNIKSVLKNEELRWYLGIAITATIIVTFNVFYGYDRITPIGETIRNA
ncbi:MAG: TrkH family potassium uptake protein, partial [Bacilli bacterium]|nr:TrkH family potassium uptake protein [Bacilli bacterium]